VSWLCAGSGDRVPSGRLRSGLGSTASLWLSTAVLRWLPRRRLVQLNSVYYEIHEFFVKKQVTSNDI